MLKASTIALAVASALACSWPAHAQDSDLARVPEEMKQLQRTYEERMQALEKRLTEAEARADKTEGAAQARQAAQVQAPATAPASASENAFNPAISLILQGTYARTSQDPNKFFISGFVPSGGEVGPPKRSFGLGESELVISANIDPYFRGTAIVALTPDNAVEVEEAFFQTLGLPRALAHVLQDCEADGNTLQCPIIAAIAPLKS